jgi:hypothetical protein
MGPISEAGRGREGADELVLMPPSHVSSPEVPMGAGLCLTVEEAHDTENADESTFEEGHRDQSNHLLIDNPKFGCVRAMMSRSIQTRGQGGRICAAWGRSF